MSDRRDYHVTPDGECHYGTVDSQECYECRDLCKQCDGYGSDGWLIGRNRPRTCPGCGGKGSVYKYAE
jgi:hypothetical protein